MRRLGLLHPGYGFERHKGYSVPEHIDALARLGPTIHHRRSFAPVCCLRRPGERGNARDCAGLVASLGLRPYLWRLVPSRSRVGLMLYVSIFVELLRSRPALAVWIAALVQAMLWFLVPVLFYAGPPGDLPNVLAVGHEFQLGTYLGTSARLLARRTCLRRRRADG